MRAALRRPGTVVFLLASALYLLAGVVVTARHQILLGDALARVASASSAVPRLVFRSYPTVSSYLATYQLAEPGTCLSL